MEFDGAETPVSVPGSLAPDVPGAVWEELLLAPDVPGAVWEEELLLAPDVLVSFGVVPVLVLLF